MKVSIIPAAMLALTIIAGCGESGGGTTRPESTTTTTVRMTYADIFQAAEAGSLAQVQAFVTSGAYTVNAVDEFKNTPLHFAANKGRIDVIKWLIENGANVNALNNDKSTPLHEAASYGQFEAVKLLVENKAKVNVQDRFGATP
jgi:ankyrin repeat protein